MLGDFHVEDVFVILRSRVSAVPVVVEVRHEADASRYCPVHGCGHLVAPCHLGVYRVHRVPGLVNTCSAAGCELHEIIAVCGSKPFHDIHCPDSVGGEVITFTEVGEILMEELVVEVRAVIVLACVE